MTELIYKSESFTQHLRQDITTYSRGIIQEKIIVVFPLKKGSTYQIFHPHADVTMKGFHHQAKISCYYWRWKVVGHVSISIGVSRKNLHHVENCCCKRYILKLFLLNERDYSFQGKLTSNRKLEQIGASEKFLFLLVTI